MIKDSISAKVEARRALILSILRQSANRGVVNMTIPEIAEQIGATLAQVKQDMRWLAQAGQVERIKYGRLRIIE